MKILSPAGNFESLKTAVFCGADEVYLGVNEFNARNNIDGFTLDMLSNAVDFCHLYGVKVCLAINILFSNDELEDALNVVTKAYNMGVDYFIVQDLGLAFLISKALPSAVIHASTQMGIHNLEGVLNILPYGFKRVVLARETPLLEIKRIRENTSVEIEYFAHGALCVSFSGNCYLSSRMFNASGNRGKCKQLCRLPYSLYFKDKKLKSGYLLSAKDFDTSKRLNELKDAGVDVLKIEGRARRPFYVGAITSAYRNLLDGKEADRQNIDLAFNRGFTPGYFDGNGDIISSVSSHNGIKVGSITKVVPKKTYKEVYFTSNRALNKKSTFKTFIGDKENAVITAYDLKFLGGNNYVLTTTANVKANEDIHVIIDFDLENELLSTYKKIDVEINLSLAHFEPIKALINIENEKIEVFGEVVSPAKSSPISIEELTDNFRKSEYFNAKITAKLSGGCFLSKGRLNEFRRKVFDEIYVFLTKKHHKNTPPIYTAKDITDSTKSSAKPLTDFIILDSYDGLELVVQKNIIYSPEIYEFGDIKNFVLTCKKLDKTPVLDLPNFALEKDVISLKNIVENLDISIVTNNYYALNFNAKKIIGTGLNIYNDLTKNILGELFLTGESEYSSKITPPLMTLRACPYKNHLHAKCDNCPHKEGYYLKMDNGKTLKIKRKKLSTCTFYLTE